MAGDKLTRSLNLEFTNQFVDFRPGQLVDSTNNEKIRSMVWEMNGMDTIKKCKDILIGYENIIFASVYLSYSQK